MSIEQRVRQLLAEFKLFLRKYSTAENENLRYLIPLLLGLMVCVFTLNAFVELTADLHANELDIFDARITQQVQSYRAEKLTTFFTFITEVGDFWGYAGLIAFLFAFFVMRYRSWKYPLQITLVLLLTSVVNLSLKTWINRQRPIGDHLVEVFTLSYPSGHAMGAMAVYGFLIYLSWYDLRKKSHKIFATLFFSFMIIAIGLSRIYLGVHFPSDVVAGYIGGLFWAAFCILVFNVISIARKKGGQKMHRDHLD